jgi:pilus assembly protein Flp/PilA
MVNRNLRLRRKSRVAFGKTFTNLAYNDLQHGTPFRPTRRGVLHMKNVVRFLKNKSGATAIEYGLIAALIAVAVIGGVSSLGTNANTTFTKVSAKMS